MEKDSPHVQKSRIERLLAELNAEWKAEFRQNHVDPGTVEIRFRIRDKETGKILGSILQDEDWAASELADMSNEEVQRKILALIQS